MEITIRDSNAFAGFGQDQCRKRERVVGANTLRLLLAAARTLWFVEQTSRAVPFALQRSRPWYRQKYAPSQLDIVWACREALQGSRSFSHTTVHPRSCHKSCGARNCFTSGGLGRETNG